MKFKALHIFSLFFILLICYSKGFPQVPVFDFSQFQQRVQVKNDTLYVVNFWATWCKPCIEELPYFEIASQDFSTQPVKFILVSMDMKTKGQQVADFLSRKNYHSESFILSAGNPNVWIDKIEPKWTGAIPMSIFYKNGKKVYFYEGDFPNTEKLKKIITLKLK